MKETLRQALHILKKDARLLRTEIALVLTAGVVYAFSYPRATGEIVGVYPAYVIQQGRWGHPSWMLLALAAAFLISRVVHAEPVAGDAHFWTTRPYRGTSLLTAKILFILLFVNVPVLLAQLVVFLDSGFALSTGWSGILWSTCLVVFVCVLPVAALAAMTPGTAAFLITALLLAGAFYSVQTNFSGSNRWPGDLEWIREAIVGLALAAVAVATLVIQYRRRRADATVRVAALTSAAALLLAWYVPLPAAMTVQAAAGGSLDASRFGMRADPDLKTLSHLAWGEDGVVLDVPLVLTGVPDDLVFDVHFLDVRFTREGRSWTARHVEARTPETGGLEPRIVLWGRDFDAARGRPVTMHVSLAATLLGNPVEEAIDVSQARFSVTEDLDCTAGRPRRWTFREDREYRDLICRTPFGRTRTHLLATNDGEGNVQVWPAYSPFPSALNLNRASEFSAGVFPADVPALEIELREPVAHFYREFELEIELEDFLTHEQSPE